MKNSLKQLNSLINRNMQLYFKDKLIFFISLLTPLILVVLFLFFLQNVYEQTLISFLPEGVSFSDNIINAFTGGWLFSSIMAVSCITVAFCSNMMVADKLNKTILDLKITPVKNSIISTSYVLSNFITTFIVCFVLFIVSLIYLAIIGWYITFVDMVLILVNMILSIMLGTLIANIIGLFINSQGALSAVSTLVSSMYGFICGAYMPLSQMGDGMKYFVSFIPGTYGTVLFRQSYLNGVLTEMEKTIPLEIVQKISESFDGMFYFFGNKVESFVMFIVLIASVILLFGIYLLLVNLKNKNKKY